jgi:hypothetical protein
MIWSYKNQYFQRTLRASILFCSLFLMIFCSSSLQAKVLRFESRSEYTNLTNNLRIFLNLSMENPNSENLLEIFRERTGKYPWGTTDFTKENVFKLIHFVILPSSFYSPGDKQSIKSFDDFKRESLSVETRARILVLLSSESLDLAKATSSSGQAYQIKKLLKSKPSEVLLEYMLALNHFDNSSEENIEIRKNRLSPKQLSFLKQINQSIMNEFREHRTSDILKILDDQRHFYSEGFLTEFIILFLSKLNPLNRIQKKAFTQRIFEEFHWKGKSLRQLSKREQERIQQVANSFRMATSRGISPYGVSILHQLIKNSPAFKDAFSTSIKSLGIIAFESEKQYFELYKKTISQLIRIDSKESAEVLKFFLNPELLDNTKLRDQLNAEAKQIYKETRKHRASTAISELFNWKFGTYVSLSIRKIKKAGFHLLL